MAATIPIAPTTYVKSPAVGNMILIITNAPMAELIIILSFLFLVSFIITNIG